MEKLLFLGCGGENGVDG